MTAAAGEANDRDVFGAPVPAPAVTPDVLHFAMVSKRGLALAAALRLVVRPVLLTYARWPRLPWPYGVVDYAGTLLPPLEGTRIETVRLEHCGAEWIEADDVVGDRAVLYLHGGAFVCCGLRTHRRMVSRLSSDARTPVLSVDYRMLPRNPISTAVADGLAGYRRLLDEGFSPERIVIAGDSAGGCLSFLVALAAVEQGLPRPSGVVAMSPLTDLDPDAKLAHHNAARDPLFPPAALRALKDLIQRVDQRVVLAGGVGPSVSPVDGELSLLPPTLIQVGSTEVLRADAELMARRLGSAGVECELQVWRGQVHVFQAAADLLPESRHALREVARFIRRVVG